MAGAVFVSGALSVFLSGKMTFWAPLWLPGGVGLVGLLIFRHRVAPALAIGAFFAYWLLLGPRGAAPAGIGAAGLAVGCLGGAAGIRRWLGWPNPLGTLRQTTVFFLLAAGATPAAVTILTVGGWWMGGFLPPDMGFFTGLTHFLSVAAGVAVSAPLALPGVGRPREIWRGRRKMIGSVMGVALVASGGLLAYVGKVESRQIRARMEDDAGRIAAAFQTRFEAHLEAMESIRSLWESSNSVERDEFRVFTRRPMERLKGFLFLAWAAEVSPGEAESMAAVARSESASKSVDEATRDLLGAYRIGPVPGPRRIGTGSEPEREESAEARLPVFYLEPTAENAEWLGADLATEPVFLEVLGRSRKSGQVRISEAFSLGDSAAPRVLAGVATAKPPASGKAGATPALRAGMVAGVLGVDLILDAALEELGGDSPPDVEILDVTGGGADAVFRLATGGDSLDPGTLPEGLTRDLDLAGRRWRLAFSPSRASFSRFMPRSGLAVQTGVLLATALLGAFILVGSGFAHRIEKEVRDRTRDLATSEERFRELAENVSEVFWILSPEDGKVEYVSPAFSAVWGVERRKRPRRFEPWHGRVHERDRERYHAKLADARRGVGFDEEYRIRRADGAVRWIRDRAFPIRDDTGRVVRVIGVADDVTAQKETESVLIHARRDAEEASLDLQRFFRVSLDLMCLAGTDGYFKKLNPAFSETLGYSDETLMSAPFVELIHPDDVEKTIAAVADLKGGERVIRFENRYRHRDGHYLWLEWNAVPDRRGDLIYAAARNITERRQMEDELRRSNAELEQFAYVASHDLREPLRMVTSFVQLLQRRHAGKLDADANDYIAHAVEGAERMRRMIEGLLELSRVERMGRPLERIDVSIPIREALENLGVAIAESGARVEVAEKLPEILGDRVQLARLFQNLIGNAIKFVEKGTVPRVAVSARRVGTFWEFSVRDNGRGIPAEHHDRIFQIFHRLDRDDAGGCGIGLSVCRRIVERHGGTIRVESPADGGSRFRLTLPAIV
ncbi:MAG: PAS domain-containing protein [Verrucomicrobiae bacterium]|nr:PAS domain-containing protein [Verrucomicrobiae bacterium]